MLISKKIHDAMNLLPYSSRIKNNSTLPTGTSDPRVRTLVAQGFLQIDRKNPENMMLTTVGKQKLDVTVPELIAGVHYEYGTPMERARILGSAVIFFDMVANGTRTELETGDVCRFSGPLHGVEVLKAARRWDSIEFGEKSFLCGALTTLSVPGMSGAPGVEYYCSQMPTMTAFEMGVGGITLGEIEARD